MYAILGVFLFLLVMLQDDFVVDDAAELSERRAEGGRHVPRVPIVSSERFEACVDLDAKGIVPAAHSQ